MSIPPRKSERKRTPAPAPAAAPSPANDDTSVSRIGKQAPLAERLPAMSDHQLIAYQMSAQRISRDPEHPKNAAALRAIPMIDDEIRRRAAGLEGKGAKPRKAAEPQA